ncbi:hypothetical protein [Rhizobium sp. MHM7A]|uniref:hypothetical protein n=1 Tax=Rhizobium sp. MHM7A TaxID=2583233 RepID=UPI00127BC310|nr:hypothetical protein [Rhizobium sp. MHM7A]TLX12082.1 hypothetical protein FFR93_16045 [Rhizobium sp. MHM7A]
MWSNIRSGKPATTRRTQPNWLVECIKAGIPFAQLPPAPAPDASHKEKSQYTWALRKAWTQKTGRTIERLTPPGYNDRLAQKKREADDARRHTNSVVDQITAEALDREVGGMKREAQREAAAFIVEDLRQAEPFTQIDTRVAQSKAIRISPVSQTVKAGYRWVRDGELGPEKADARAQSLSERYAASGLRLSSGATYVPVGE